MYNDIFQKNRQFSLDHTFVLLCGIKMKILLWNNNAEISVCREAKMQTQSRVLFMKGPIWTRGKQKVWSSGQKQEWSGCLEQTWLRLGV